MTVDLPQRTEAYSHVQIPETVYFIIGAAKIKLNMKNESPYFYN